MRKYGIVIAGIVVAGAVAGATLAHSSAAPTITRFTPTHALVNARVTIYGTNLRGAQVQFNGMTAKTATVNAAGTQIVAVINSETMDGPGPIGVITAGGTVQSKVSFTVSPPTAAAPQTGVALSKLKPAILSITPLKAKAGAKVTIKGANFGGAMSVSFGGVQALYTIPASSRIVATVPKKAKTGLIKIVTSLGVAIGKSKFVVTASGSTTTPGGGSTTTTTGSSTTTTSAALIGDPTAGASVFQQAGCSSCHTMKAASATGAAGPNLDAGHYDQPTIVQQVTNGGEGMPAFSPQFSTTQINNLAAYVYSSTH